MLNLYCYIFNVSSNSESYLSIIQNSLENQLCGTEKDFTSVTTQESAKFKLIYQIWVLVRKIFHCSCVETPLLLIYIPDGHMKKPLSRCPEVLTHIFKLIMSLFLKPKHILPFNAVMFKELIEMFTVFLLSNPDKMNKLVQQIKLMILIQF
uniref:Transformation/transcription domain-associated protein n=1 Tax=Heterorhabditis bacteriophora TaxID=37862 RepID=A0A1I7W9Z7_HETBA